MLLVKKTPLYCLEGDHNQSGLTLGNSENMVGHTWKAKGILITGGIGEGINAARIRGLV